MSTDLSIEFVKREKYCAISSCCRTLQKHGEVSILVISSLMSPLTLFNRHNRKKIMVSTGDFNVKLNSSDKDNQIIVEFMSLFRLLQNGCCMRQRRVLP